MDQCHGRVGLVELTCTVKAGPTGALPLLTAEAGP